MKQLALELIHYGSESFDLKEFEPIENRRFFPKPDGGLWSSPVDSEWGWKDYCEAEQYGLVRLKTSFTFLYVGYTITIDSYSDLGLMQWNKGTGMGIYTEWPDFEKMVKKGVDGIYLTARGQATAWFGEVNTHGRNLYGWDCECVLVMNPDCVFFDEGNKRIKDPEIPEPNDRFRDIEY